MAYTTGGPNYGPQPTHPGEAPKSGRTKKGLIALGAVVGVGAVVGGSVWAATTFFVTGAQPAEALPDSTIVYASVDLDPKGAQKVEAIKMLRKFPAIQDELKLDPDDNPIQRFFNESEACDGVDYADDVEPWLGSRAAVAMVDLDGEPQPVGVLQVKDADKAEAGVKTLQEKCGSPTTDEPSSDSEDGGGAFVVSGDWLIAAETEEIADRVAQEGTDSPLSEDDSYTKWTDAAGDDGIITVYVAKGAADFAEDGFEQLGSTIPTPSTDFGSDTDSDFDSDFDSEFDFDTDTDSDLDSEFDFDTPSSEPTELPEEIKDALKDFDGAAMKIRFEDAGLELETAVGVSEEWRELVGEAVASDLVGSLPEDSIAAFGLRFEDGWVDRMAEQFASVAGEDMSVEEFYSDVEDETGLALPEDLETLLGEGIAVALGPDIDSDAIANGGPEELPVAVKVKGDPDEIDEVLEKIRAQMDDDAELLTASEGDGVVAFGPHSEFRDEVAKDGSLADNEVYDEIVGSDDAVAVFFVNFNASDDWLVRLAEDSDEAAENLEPLRAFGMSAWVEDDVNHGLLRLTTD